MNTTRSQDALLILKCLAKMENHHIIIMYIFNKLKTNTFCAHVYKMYPSMALIVLY